MPSRSRRKAVIGRICTAFKLEGLMISKQAARGLESQLRAEPDSRKGEALRLVVDKLKERFERLRPETGNLVSVDDVSAVIADLTKDDDDRAHECLQIFNAFQLPRLRWSAARKELYHVSAADGNRLHGTAEDKLRMARDRLELVQQRLMRHPLFSAPRIGGPQRDYVRVTPVESLKGAEGPQVLLGRLSQLEEGAFFLEDANASVRLVLDGASSYGGLFTEGCIVLVEGRLSPDGDAFLVANLGLPPPEPRAQTLSLMRRLEHLGVAPLGREETRLRAMCDETEEGMFVVLSNVHLDDPRVMEALRALFAGFDASAPTLFVLCGNFTSRPFGQGANDRAELTQHFDALARLIARHGNIRERSRFVFVPGPHDAGGSGCLPRPPLPRVFTKRLRQTLPTATFATNPCRLRYYAQEVVIFREDLLSAMRRGCVVPPTDGPTDGPDGDGPDGDGPDGGAGVGESDASAGGKGSRSDPTDHLVKTVCDQGHLCPLPQHVRPVHWALDHALWLYPLPDTIIFADYYDQYLNHYEGTTALNPGSFPTDFSFVVYRPSSQDVEFSRVPA
jgi:DNA polymerase epsilon subunit 2